MTLLSFLFYCSTMLVKTMDFSPGISGATHFCLSRAGEDPVVL